MKAYEDAVAILLKERRIKERWQAEEFWGVVATLVATALTVKDPAQFVKTALARLRTAGPTLVIQLVANATWDRPPLAIGDAIVGDAGWDFLGLIKEKANGRPSVDDASAALWLAEQVESRTHASSTAKPVAIACWSTGQAEIARKESEAKLQSIVDLTVFLERDLRAHEIYRRGSINRPGVRGLTLDRGALGAGLAEGSQLELATFPLMLGDFATGRKSVHWYGAEPLPLGKLLGQEYLRKAVGSCFNQDPVSNRMRVAARWYAEAHYSLADDDAALALGVAMDSLLTGEGSMPGSAMADRFAFLAANPSERRDRVSRYLSLYKVRSSVAHGGKSGKLNDDGFLSDYMAAVHDTGWRLLALRDTFKPSSEQQITVLFDELRWGMRIWPMPTGDDKERDPV